MTYQPEDQIDCQTFLADLKIKESISITDLSPRKRVQTFASAFFSSAIHYITSVHLIEPQHTCTAMLHKSYDQWCNQIHKAMVQYTYALHADQGSDNLWPAIVDCCHMTSGKNGEIEGREKYLICKNQMFTILGKKGSSIFLCKTHC